LGERKGREEEGEAIFRLFVCGPMCRARAGLDSTRGRAAVGGCGWLPGGPTFVCARLFLLDGGRALPVIVSSCGRRRLCFEDRLPDGENISPGFLTNMLPEK
jgi:hypothetical protein